MATDRYGKQRTERLRVLKTTGHTCRCQYEEKNTYKKENIRWTRQLETTDDMERDVNMN